jgi:uncharacterized membrane protein
MGLDLAAGDVAALDERTEGWVAGLQLAALAPRGSADVPGFIVAIAGSHHYVVDYLADEVLRQQPEEVRYVPMRTAILVRLSAHCAMPSQGGATAGRCWNAWCGRTSSSSHGLPEAVGLRAPQKCTIGRYGRDRSRPPRQRRRSAAAEARARRVQCRNWEVPMAGGDVQPRETPAEPASVPKLGETAVTPADVPGPHEGPTAPAGDETPPTPAREPESREGSRELDRIIFFSDAVFAIAITLLVLYLKVPAIPARQVAARLGPALRGLGPLYFSYAISFVVIGAFWAAHHRIYRFITGYDGTLMALNTLLLLCIAFLPFPSAVLGQYGDTPLAPMLFAAVLATVSFLLLLIWAYTGGRCGDQQRAAAPVLPQRPASPR